MVIRDVCPRCKSPKYQKNGHLHNGKQNQHCHNCGRQFVQCFAPYLIADDTRELIERLLLERLSKAACIDRIVLATSEDPRNEPLARYVRELGYAV